MKMLVCGKDHVGRILLYMGDFEPRITRIAQALLSEGDCVLDIGSNQGWFSLVAAPLVGTSGSVHAFEPQHSLNGLLRASLSMNDIANVSIHEVALSDEAGPAELYKLKGNSGVAQLAPREGVLWSTESVERVNAFDYLSSLNLSPIRMVKIDVEGHDETVFSAAASFFDHNPPQVVVFESAGEDTLLDRPLGKLLAGRRYRLYSLCTSLRKLRFADAAERTKVKTIDHVALLQGPSLERDMKALGLTK